MLEAWHDSKTADSWTDLTLDALGMLKRTMGIIFTHNEMDWDFVDRVEAGRDHWRLSLAITIQRIVVLIAVLDRNLGVPFA